MSFKEPFQKICKSDWIIALFLLIIFLLNNGYILGWDDQHLEIPMLKGLIDNGLYVGDYYVESLKANFPSYFYRILAKIITIKQIPAAYLILYLLSRYFLFFWMYKLWRLISQRKFTAFVCVLTLLTVGRVEEFLYRTFSHQEFGLAFAMAGIYFFYRKRFVLASIILGISANIHAVYSLFPMMYLGLYLLVNIKEYGWKTLVKSSLSFLVCLVPLGFLIAQKYSNTHLPADSPLLHNWMDLYWLACPQNFVFQDIPLDQMMGSLKMFFRATDRFLILIALYALNFFYNQDFRKDKKVQTVAATTLFFLILSSIFTYIFPSRFIIDLNLVRNQQYLQFFLFGYTAMLLVRLIDQRNILLSLGLGILFSLLRFRDMTVVYAALAMILALLISQWTSRERTGKRTVTISFLSALLLLCIAAIAYNFNVNRYTLSSKWTFLGSTLFIIGVSIYLWFSKEGKWPRALNSTIILAPIVAIFISFCFYHVKYLQISRHGQSFWQLQRNWIDMQNYVRENTPKGALLLVPYDTEMGGFRIFSEREIVVSYRDCGIIGFDYGAAVEWLKRKNDIDPFRVFIKRPQLLDDALRQALLKYKVNYIVFMKYAQPKSQTGSLEKIYENLVFALFKVAANPIEE